MYKVVKKIDFCYGHRLLDYNGKCAHPHGHNAALEIEIVGKELDAAGMLYDFSAMKRLVLEFVDARLDHRMLLRRDDPLVAALRDAGEGDYLFLMDSNPTAENIAKLICDEGRARNLPISAVRLWEAVNSYAEYRTDPPT